MSTCPVPARLIAAVAIATVTASIQADDLVVGEQLLQRAIQPDIRPRIRLNIQGLHPIDHIVYGRTRNEGESTVQGLAAIWIQHITAQYELSDAQQQKLKLAGQSAVRRFFLEVNELRLQYDAASNRPIERRTIESEAETLRERRLKLFDQQSFLAKVTAKTLTSEQLRKYQAIVKEQRRLRHRSNIESVVREIELRIVLQIPQHEALTELMLTEIPVPEADNADEEAILRYHISLLPEEKLQAIVSGAQWIELSSILDAFHEFGSFLGLERETNEILATVGQKENHLDNFNAPADASHPDQPVVLK